MPYQIPDGEVGFKMTDLIRSEALVTATISDLTVKQIESEGRNILSVQINLTLKEGDFLKRGDMLSEGYSLKLGDIRNAQSCSFKIALLPGTRDKVASVGSFVKAEKHTSFD